MSEVRWRSRRKMTKIENHIADVEISFKLFFSFRGFFELEMKSKAPSRIVGRGKVGQRKNKGRRTKNLESFPVSSEKHFSFLIINENIYTHVRTSILVVRAAIRRCRRWVLVSACHLSFSLTLHLPLFCTFFLHQAAQQQQQQHKKPLFANWERGNWIK